MAKIKSFWHQRSQIWAEDQIHDDHEEVLYLFGEYVMFVLMWRVSDFKAGMVSRCSTCYGNRLRISEAYKQATDARCLDCFGTTFENGYRAKLIRPALIVDNNITTVRERHGEVTTDRVSLETTTDFYSRAGDFMIRADGTRYQMEEMGTLVVRSGFDIPYQHESLGGIISGAKLEDPSSVCYLIPPTQEESSALLHSLSVDRHTPREITEYDVFRENINGGTPGGVFTPPGFDGGNPDTIFGPVSIQGGTP